MIALALSVLLALAPQPGTIHTVDGGRLRGTVLEAGAATLPYMAVLFVPLGVSNRVSNGSVRGRITRDTSVPSGTTIK